MKIDPLVIPVERVQQAIYLVRGQKVMLDKNWLNSTESHDTLPPNRLPKAGSGHDKTQETFGCKRLFVAQLISALGHPAGHPSARSRCGRDSNHP